MYTLLFFELSDEKVSSSKGDEREGGKKEDVGETISISVSESCRYVSFLFSVGEGLVSLSLKKR